MLTEKEKMLRGEYYNAEDKGLVNERKDARKLVNKFNNLSPDDGKIKKELLNQLFQKETKCYIEPPFRCDYGYNIDIGDYFYANFGCIILDVNTVKIGTNVKFGPNVQIYTATHPIDWQERINGKEMGYPISIGDNVWIGGGAIICPGVTIGKNAVIGAGAVVRRDVPDDAIATGNPCKITRQY